MYMKEHPQKQNQHHTANIGGSNAFTANGGGNNLMTEDEREPDVIPAQFGK